MYMHVLVLRYYTVLLCVTALHVTPVLQHVQNALEMLPVTAQLCQDRCDQAEKAGSVALKFQTCSMPMRPCTTIPYTL